MVKSSFAFFTASQLPPPNGMIFEITRMIITSNEKTKMEKSSPMK